LGCAAFVAIGFWLWFQGSLLYRVFAVTAWAFFGFVALFALKRLLRRVPSLIINEYGIFDNSSAFGAYMLNWEEVNSVYISSARGQRFISIKVRDLEGFLGRQTGVNAKAMRGCAKMVGAPIAISTLVLPLTPAQLLEVVRKKCPAVRVG
jgi:hypothetical protein